MNVNDPSRRLVSRKLKLPNLDYELQYKNGLINTQADTQFRPFTSYRTIREIDGEISSFAINGSQAHKMETSKAQLRKGPNVHVYDYSLICNVQETSDLVTINEDGHSEDTGAVLEEIFVSEIVLMSTST